jgi:hypothetical protein
MEDALHFGRDAAAAARTLVRGDNGGDGEKRRAG